MDELKALQVRIAALEDIEAIRKLKARYWFSIDRKQWEEFGECFADDAVMDVPPVTHWVGKKEIVQSLPKILASYVTVHQGHHADINLISDTEAKATWAMYDNLQSKRFDTKLEGYGFYEDEYVKENGKWKIKKLKLSRFFVKNEKIDWGGQSGL